MNKSCSKCKNLKAISNFSRNSRNKDGLHAWCKECKKLHQREWAARNRESESERQREWYEFNKDKKNEKNKEWQKNNRHKSNAISAKRRASKNNATPSWLNKEHIENIKVFYKRAIELTKETGIPHQVDHVIPLQGKGVCGLHVPWNLQILTKYDNLVKGNSLETILNLN